MCLDILSGSSTTDLYFTCPQKFWLRKVHAVSRLLRDYLHIHISGGWENWHIMQMKAKWLNTFLIYTSSSSPPTLAHVLVMDWLPESWVSGFGNSCHSLLDNAPLRVRYPIEKDFCRFRIVVVALSGSICASSLCKSSGYPFEGYRFQENSFMFRFINHIGIIKCLKEKKI